MGCSWPWLSRGATALPSPGAAPSDAHHALAAAWGPPGEELWHFRAEELEDNLKTTGARQKWVRASSDLLPFT